MTETTKAPIKDLRKNNPVKDIYNKAPINDIYTDYVTDVPKPLDELTTSVLPFKDIYERVTYAPIDTYHLTPYYKVRD